MADQVKVVGDDLRVEVVPGSGGEAECKDPNKEGGCCGGKCVAPVEGVGVSQQAKTLKEVVAESLAASGPKVRDRVVEHLVEEELKKRTDLVLKALVKKEELEKEIHKVRPDPKTALFDANGKTVREALYTDEQVKVLKAHREQLGKVEKALELALNADKPDFTKLREVLGK